MGVIVRDKWLVLPNVSYFSNAPFSYAAVEKATQQDENQPYLLVNTRRAVSIVPLQRCYVPVALLCNRYNGAAAAL